MIMIIISMEKGTAYLSQTHYAEEILRTYNFWNATPRLTPIDPTRASTKTTVTRILPLISIEVIVVLSVA